MVATSQILSNKLIIKQIPTDVMGLMYQSLLEMIYQSL